MLNRVIDKTHPLNQDVFDILNEALAVLPQLIEQLKGNKEPIANLYQLIDRADTLGKWKKPEIGEQQASAKRETEQKVDVEPEIDVEQETEELVVDDVVEEEIDLEIDASHTIEISENEVMDEISEDELDLGVEEVESDLSVDLVEEESTDEFGEDFNIDLTEELEALHIASSDNDIGDEELVLEDISLEGENDTGESLSEDTLQIHIDPVLFEIFKGESQSHLQQISKMLDQHKQSIEPLTANAELLRALHTLFGSARTAEVDEIAELCGALEKYIRLYIKDDNLILADSGVKLVEDVANKVSQMLAALEEKNHPLESDLILLKRIADLSEEKNNESIKSAAETSSGSNEAGSSTSAEGMPAEESLVSYSDVDDELVEIFLEEAEELLDNCENSLQRWNADNEDDESVQDLQRHLHTLKGGARMADLSPVGDLTHALESFVVAVNDKQLPFVKETSNIFHDALDSLSDMLSKVKAREPLAPATSLITLRCR